MTPNRRLHIHTLSGTTISGALRVGLTPSRPKRTPPRPKRTPPRPMPQKQLFLGTFWRTPSRPKRTPPRPKGTPPRPTPQKLGLVRAPNPTRANAPRPKKMFSQFSYGEKIVVPSFSL